jgi:NADH dehydrogenase
MFGPGDAFLTPLLEMLRQMPAFPLFGGGKTKLQPAYVEDVAEAMFGYCRRLTRTRYMSWPGRGFTPIENC